MVERIHAVANPKKPGSYCCSYHGVHLICWEAQTPIYWGFGNAAHDRRGQGVDYPSGSRYHILKDHQNHKNETIFHILLESQYGIFMYVNTHALF